MRNAKLAVLLSVTALATACNHVVSLYPLYDELTLVEEPLLVGSWRAGEDETWTFSSDGNKYRLVVTEAKDDTGADETTELEVGLVRLSGRLFLDFYSEDAGLTGAPAHVFTRIQLQQNTLQIGIIDITWMKKKLSEENWFTHMPYSGNSRVVLTAPTRDLQYFFRKYAADDTAFSDTTGRDQPTVLERIR